ncbi:flagellin [Amaricoccus sp.]|uniref:flagellin n=1 Tax=Amaricoccus sp. TaxID=1872485 RepID=UPI0026378DBC|nr:flagellin [Amaricoccus sp.]HRO10327.1 flagellin [Amaricoccus sp.]
MRVTGGSDLARMQALQKQALATRDRLDTAATEMTTNLKSSRFDATGGNLTRLFALERSLDRNAVFSDNITLTELRLDTMQATFGQIQTALEDLSIDMVSATSLGDYSAAMRHATTARSDFAATVGQLNGQVAGQSLFAGTTTDRPALAAADALLADLDALAAGSADAAAAIAAIDDYFAKPAGAFYTSGYVGSTDDLTAVAIGEGQRVDYGIRADQEELVAVLRAQAMAAVVAGGAFAGDQAGQMAMLSEAGDRLLAAKEGILDLRSAVGSQQEQVETAKAQRVSEHDTLDLARSKLMATDPVEAASAYQALEVQLEAIYTVTARLAGLRFVNYMR